MHVGKQTPDGTSHTTSKMEAMYFPADQKTNAEMQSATADLIFGDDNEYYIPFTNTFKYLGCHINTSITNETEIPTAFALPQIKQRH